MKNAILILVLLYTTLLLNFCSDDDKSATDHSFHAKAGDIISLPTSKDTNIDATFVDTDGDGKIDGIDIDKNGSANMTIIGDIKENVISVDNNADGTIDFYIILDEVTGKISINTKEDGSGDNIVFVINLSGDILGIDINGDGISDLAIGGRAPRYAASNLSFTDEDNDVGQIAGTLKISKAADETDITQYVLYWGTDVNTKSGEAISYIDKTGKDIDFTVKEDTVFPSTVSYFIVLTKNTIGEMSEGLSLKFVDKGVPVNKAEAITFADTDLNYDELEGTITITKALDEIDITDYTLYWGGNSTTKCSDPIVVFEKSGSNMTYTIPANTQIPVTATHFLVFSKNNNWEMTECTSLEILDRAIPVNKAFSISFADTDYDKGELRGNVTIGKATYEDDISHYILYWGSSPTAKLGNPITTIAKTGINLTYTFPENTVIPSGATHFLVFTKNDEDEMPTGISSAIVDKYAIIMYNAGLHDGNLGGRTGADSICSSYASKPAGFSEYHAYISINGSDYIANMTTNLNVPTSVPVKSTTGSVIANNWSILVSGTFLLSTLEGAGVCDNKWWSASQDNGTINSENCLNFSSNSSGQNGRCGANNVNAIAYKSDSSQTCNNSFYVLCVAW